MEIDRTGTGYPSLHIHVQARVPGQYERGRHLQQAQGTRPPTYARNS